MFISIDRIKLHLNIDVSFTGEDDYLEYLESVAEAVVEKHIDNNLSVLCDGDGALPAPLLHAMLLFIGDMYQNRESVVFGRAKEIPFNYDYILSLYKNYSNTHNV